MVTMKSGSARLTVARQLNSGATNTGSVGDHGTALARSVPSMAAIATPAASTPTTA